MSVEERDETGLHWALLKGYAWDSTEPLPGAGEHVQWLDKYAPKVAILGGNLHIIGLADRSHNPRFPNYNAGLSLRRASRIRAELLRRLNNMSLAANLYVHGLGDRETLGPRDRWPTDRAVIVAHYIGVNPPPPPPWLRCMGQPCPSRLFYIRSLGSVSLGVGLPETPFAVSQALMPFMISDGQWALRFTVKFGGFGAGVGVVELPVSLDVAPPGPWHAFRLDQEKLVTAFRETFFQITSAETAGHEATGIRPVQVLQIGHRSNSSFVRINPFETGETIGTSLLELVGASHAVGGVDRGSDHLVRGGPSIRCMQELARGAQSCEDE